jgi:type I restriction enzyme S subunit
MSETWPADWQAHALKDILAIEFPGAWGNDPPASRSTNACVLRSTNLDDEGHIDYSTGAKRFFTSRDLATKKLSNGDILLEASGGGPGRAVGRVALFRSPGDQFYACSNFFRTLRPRPIVHSGFLAWYLQWIYQQPSIWQFQQQTTGIINLKYKDYLRQSIKHPGLPEQRRIAEILDTAGKAIQSTERLIAKLEQTKQGLLHDLLTRGIDRSFRLAGPGEQPNKLIHDPEFHYPASWNTATVGEVCVIRDVSRKPISSEERFTRQGDFPYYGPTGVLDYIDHYRYEGTYALIGEDGDHFLKFASRPMTQLISGKFNVNNHAHVVQGGPGCLTEWFWLFFLHRDITLHLTRQGAGRFKLSQANLLGLTIALPPVSQQWEIVSHFSLYESEISSEKTALAKLRLLKEGLANDLLTGRVRVGATA